MKRLGMFFPALLLIAGMVFLGCPGPNDNDPDTSDITWTLSQDGEEDANQLGTKTTTAITITLSREGDLTGNGVVVLSTGNVTQGAITGSGTVWKVPVTVINPGEVDVTINKTGFAAGTKSIRVIKEGTTPPITYEAVADGTANTATSTKITFTFDKDVTGLLASEISITPVGVVTAGALTGSAKVWTLALTAVSAEQNVTVKITKSGIDAGNRTVAVHKLAGESDWVAGGGVKISDIIKIDGVEDEFEAEGELGKFKGTKALKLDLVTIDSKKVNRVTLTFDPPVDLSDYDGISYSFELTDITTANLNGCSIATEFVNSTAEESRKLGYWTGTTSPTYNFVIDARDTDTLGTFADFTEFDTLIITFDGWEARPNTKTDTGVYLYSVVLHEKSGEDLPEGVYMLSDEPTAFVSTEEWGTQGGWDLKGIVGVEQAIPKYLLVFVAAGGDGLANTTVIHNSPVVDWTQTQFTTNWLFDGTWAAPAKIFIVDLSACNKYDELEVADVLDDDGGFLQFGFQMGADNSKLTLTRITGAAVVFADTEGGDMIDALVEDAEAIGSTGAFWAIDAEGFGE